MAAEAGSGDRRHKPTCGGELVLLGTRRQCAWLLSTYLKEGEEQKEVLEAKDDEEKESEVD